MLEQQVGRTGQLNAAIAFAEPVRWDDVRSSYHVVPRSSGNYIDRERLTYRLDNPDNFALTIITAPAGFGKTTLLTSWQKRTNRKIAWLSIDDKCSDLKRFAFHFLVAIKSSSATGVPDSVDSFQTLTYFDEPGVWREVAAILIRHLHRIHLPTTIVLDDYHYVADDRIHQLVANVIEKLPAAVNIAIASRSTPTLPLSRFRARGQLLEINAEHLRFNESETANFLKKVTSADLSTSEIREIWKGTEGWVAGLQLAGIGLQEGVAVQDMFTPGAASKRYALSYLLEEVLSRQPDEVQKFLKYTAVLERMTPPLCDEITGASNSAQMIDYLRSENLFIIQVDQDGQWFRYHHLFRALLLDLLESEMPNIASGLLSVASEWYANNGNLADAVTTAARARNWNRVADLVKPVVAPLLIESKDYRDWLKGLPEEAFAVNTTLRMFYVWTTLISHEIRRCKSQIKLLQKTASNDDAISIQISIVNAVMRCVTRDESIQVSAERLLEATKPIAYAHQTSQNVLGFLYTFEGKPLKALDLLTEGLELANKLNEPNSTVGFMYRGNMALACVETCRMSQALTHCGEHIEIHNDTKVSPNIHLARAQICFERNQLVEADSHLNRMRESMTSLGIELSVAASYWLAIKVHIASDSVRSAQTALDSLAQYLRRNGNDSWLSFSQTIQTSILLHERKFDDAGEWLNKNTSFEPKTLHYWDEAKLQLLIMWLIKKPRSDADSTLLDTGLRLTLQLHEFALNFGRVLDAALYNIHRSLILHRLGRESEALERLNDASLQMVPERLTRRFLDYYDEITAVFAGAGARISKYPLLIDLKHLIDADTTRMESVKLITDNRMEMISERELEVLNLIAMGLTNIEIANNLVVSINTVKTHIKNLYFKLDAHSRTHVVAIARETRLI